MHARSEALLGMTTASATTAGKLTHDDLGKTVSCSGVGPGELTDIRHRQDIVSLVIGGATTSVTPDAVVTFH